MQKVILGEKGKKKDQRKERRDEERERAEEGECYRGTCSLRKRNTVRNTRIIPLVSMVLKCYERLGKHCI